ncbi:fibroblast growth factor receptor-like 1 [Patella vulgata]|uniref:fibroblast growth factor receptor-like 1 n=1 Tax=Patella vulgata TaxID=6465 RepID=UPI00218071CE|nr:fibroblast growth factor receptor-like 1 [Patella vulgata]XP_050395679.1 fibroblast growth factor receptor-like 1 [Patella vulgata]XP_050395680.1 fibroblast growth factor receptor-like 1 [Patella vulgata]XP_050395681.1 fibroblast growth factor receptor-like 1 [Patella vulgata]
MAYLRQWLLLVLVQVLQICTASGPPRVIGKVHHRHIAKVGRNTKLLCPVEADPPPLMQWNKNNHNIPNGWTRFKVSQDGQLRIREIEMDDAGTYVCKAINGFGNIKINYTLIVVDEEKGIVKQDNSLYNQSPDEDLRKEGAPPVFTELPKKDHIVRPVGSSVRLKCRATGNPRPHVTWFFNNQLIQIDEDPSKHPQWILKLQNVNELETGEYTCKVSNRLGQINHTYTLEVIEKIKTKPVLISPHPMNTTVDYGGTASFQCRVRSVVQPHIQWLKRVEDLDSIPNLNTTIEVKGQKFVVLKTGEVWNRPDGTYVNKLLITHATESDGGMYICLGANSMGYSFRSAFLTVSSGPNTGLSYTNQDSSSPKNHLPLFIAVPSAIIGMGLFGVLLFYIRRRRQCNNQGSNLKIQRFPVPTQDKDFYTNNYHNNSNMLPISREKIPKTPTPSVDLYSDISSVSQHHPHHHHHQHNQYSY